jgi:uncharacterized protein GlcG (DUF336 family)
MMLRIPGCIYISRPFVSVLESAKLMKKEPVVNKLKLLISAVSLLALSGHAVAETKPYVASRSLTAELASRAVTAAQSACAQKGYQVSVALVDRSGILQAFVRNPLAGSHTVDVSTDKARTSASFQTTTLELMTNPRLKQLNYARGVLLIGGGLPISVGGQFYGAIGVSGAPAEKNAGDIDEECANAGMAVIKEELEFAE